MNKILPNTIILKDQIGSQTEGEAGKPPRWLRFSNPTHVIQTKDLSQVRSCLKDVEKYVDEGFYAAGLISYEASPAFDPAMITHTASDFPLMWFGIYRECETISELPDGDQDDFQLGEWKPSVSVEHYNAAIAKIKQHIYDGDTYQVNYTMRLHNEFSGDPWNLFRKLQKVQHTDYQAYVTFDKFSICSVSPELFFDKDQQRISCRPMKGTIKRGLTNKQDAERAQWLRDSEKNQSENVMIVDMIRNDLGTIAKLGTVNVEKLFSIEKYATVHQMTSTVAATTTASISEIIGKMFPCASITGAPKVKTMEIIRDLEVGPRGIYTGSIGYIAPNGKTQFNVAIRTVVIDTETNIAEYGVGGGIVWDSDATDEYEECKTKAAVLMQEPPEFDLFESLLWDAEHGLYLLDNHIARLKDSAEYFGFQLALDDLEKKVADFIAQQHTGRCRVKIIFSHDGKITLNHFPLKDVVGNKVGIARDPVPQHSPFICHKTTNRVTYNQALEQDTEYKDLLFLNHEGFVTESAIANVVVEVNGELLTPPVEHGLLPGVFRRMLLDAGVIKEAPIHIDTLLKADNIFLTNSLRGWMKLVPEEPGKSWRIQTEFCYDTTPPSGSV